MPAESHKNQKLEAANSYFLFFVSGILILLTEKHNKFVRFHAYQSTYFSILFLLFIGITNYIPFIGYYIVQLSTTIFFFTWMYLIYAAYSSKEIRLPIIGDLAFRDSRK